MRRNPNWNVGQLQDEYQVYRARKLAKKVIEGSYKEQYERLWDYAKQIKKTNPGSTVGFLEVCKPIVSVDGYHLKGPWSRQILTAVDVDGNNGYHTGLGLKHLLWPAARAATLPWWEAEMDNMKKKDPDAWGG
ncbi:unnamed protein product [Prunus armeniaca]